MKKILCIFTLALACLFGSVLSNAYAHTREEMSFAKRSFVRVRFIDGYHDGKLSLWICFSERKGEREKSTDEKPVVCVDDAEITLSDIKLEVDKMLPPGTAMISGIRASPNPRSSVLTETTIYLPSEKEWQEWNKTFAVARADHEKSERSANAPKKVSPPTIRE